LSPVQIPVEYDPKAQCPEWESFVRTTFPDDAQELAWEIIAWLIATTSIQKAVILTGEGANGKSAFLSGLTAFLGGQNVSNVSLHQLERDKFAVADLFGKLANICSDIPASKLFETATFKAITGGDRIRAERKYHDAFFFQARAKLLFSANQLPTSDDGTHAFARRLLILPFERTFEEGSGETIPRDELDRRLSDPGELSGLLNRALAALPRLQAQGFSNPESVQRAIEEYCRLGNPVSEFVQECLDTSPERYVEKRRLINRFNQWTQKNKRPPMTDTAFGKALRRVATGVTDSQKVIDGKLREVYCGVGFPYVKVFNARSYS
jgi:putative DNA primase/helicase